jgi:hypothetical protein
MFYNAISVVCVLPMPRKVGIGGFFVKIFRIFQGVFCAYFSPPSQSLASERFSEG